MRKSIRSGCWRFQGVGDCRGNAKLEAGDAEGGVAGDGVCVALGVGVAVGLGVGVGGGGIIFSQ